MNNALLILILFICLVGCSTKIIIADKDEQLYLATRNGEDIKVQELINQGANVDYKKQYIFGDLYPINEAIRNGNLEIIKLLITHGAKIDTESDNRHCLSDAVYKGNKKIIIYLLSKGIYFNRSCTSSLIFSALDSLSFEMLKFVIEDLGVCVNSKEFLYGDTPIYETISEERLTEAHYLIKKGANINIQNKKKETPLHEAVIAGKIKMIELFLKHGAYINIRDDKGLTPLDYAEKMNNMRIVELLKRK